MGEEELFYKRPPLKTTVELSVYQDKELVYPINISTGKKAKRGIRPLHWIIPLHSQYLKSYTEMNNYQPNDKDRHFLSDLFLPNIFHREMGKNIFSLMYKGLTKINEKINIDLSEYIAFQEDTKNTTDEIMDNITFKMNIPCIEIGNEIEEMFEGKEKSKYNIRLSMFEYEKNKKDSFFGELKTDYTKNNCYLFINGKATTKLFATLKLNPYACYPNSGGVFYPTDEAKELLKMINSIPKLRRKYVLIDSFGDDLKNNYLAYFTRSDNEFSCELTKDKGNKKNLLKIFTVDVLKRYKEKLLDNFEKQVLQFRKQSMNKNGMVEEVKTAILNYYSTFEINLDVYKIMCLIYLDTLPKQEKIVEEKEEKTKEQKQQEEQIKLQQKNKQLNQKYNISQTIEISEKYNLPLEEQSKIEKKKISRKDLNKIKKLQENIEQYRYLLKQWEGFDDKYKDKKYEDFTEDYSYEQYQSDIDRIKTWKNLINNYQHSIRMITGETFIPFEETSMENRGDLTYQQKKEQELIKNNPSLQKII